MAIRDLRNKQVLVTGAAAGIGLETALAFARCGARLILVDLSEDALVTAKAAVEATGSSALCYGVNVADEAAMQSLANQIHERIAALDVLVNNAGIAYVGPFVDTPSSTWRRVLDVNVLGVVHGCALFIPPMLAAKGPRQVVNVASAAGLGPAAGLSAYVASKHAVVGLSDTLALELATSEVGVSLICPGATNTAIAKLESNTASQQTLIKQGAAIGDYYRRHGAHPRVIGEAIVRAVQTGQGKVTVGPMATSGHFAQRLLPRSLYLKLARQLSIKIGYWRD